MVVMIWSVCYEKKEIINYSILFNYAILINNYRHFCLFPGYFLLCTFRLFFTHVRKNRLNS